MVDIQEWIEDESGRFKKIEEGGSYKREDGKWLGFWIEKIDSEMAEKKDDEYFTGQLKITKELSKFSPLTCLGIDETLITGIDLSGCFHLFQLEVTKNPNLTSVGFLAQLPNPQKLFYLELSCGNFAETTLDFLEPFTNLKQIKLSVAHCTEDKWCGKTAEEWIKEGVYNKFRGSLKPLEKLLKLEELHIDDTDIDSDYEFFLEKSKKTRGINFSCYCNIRPEAGCKKIAEKLKEQIKEQKKSSERETNQLIEELKKWKEETPEISKESKTANDIDPEKDRVKNSPPISAQPPYQALDNHGLEPFAGWVNEKMRLLGTLLAEEREKNNRLKKVNGFLFFLIILLGAIASFFYYKWKKRDKQKQY